MTDIYRVKSGESLSIIARDLLGDINRWPEIAYLNGISHPYFIYPGQVLELPPEKNSGIVEVVSTIPKTLAPPAKHGNFSLSPATVKLLVAGAAIYLLFIK